MNSDGVLLSYTEFLDKFKIPIRPREYAIVMMLYPIRYYVFLKMNVMKTLIWII